MNLWSSLGIVLCDVECSVVYYDLALNSTYVVLCLGYSRDSS